jgi:16S rRNA (uracil1498-N3)-methyltransferase
MARRYLVDPLPDPGLFELPPDVSHHLAHVLRAGLGESVTLFDGRGRTCEARLVSLGGAAVRVETGPIHESIPEPGPRILLAVALPKGPHADWLFEQATALGVHAIHPVLSHHSENRRSRLSRWRRIAGAAAGQCGRDFLPTIHEPQPLAGFLTREDLPRERYLAHRAGPTLESCKAGAAALLVGPEGGFTAQELADAEDRGFRPRSLGSLVLRVETAALAGAVLLARPHGTG